jgi:hypothetical protein
MLEDILEWCGYNSAFSMLTDNMSNEDLLHLLESIVDSPTDAADFIKEEVEEIATKTYEWFDRDAAIDRAENLANLIFKDGDD